MYILVRQEDQIIIGNAVNPIDEISLSKKGILVYEVDDSEFSVNMLGSKLDSFIFSE